MIFNSLYLFMIALILPLITPDAVATDASSIRRAVREELPKLSDTERICEFGLNELVVTYKDNDYIQAFVDLIGGDITTELYHDDSDKINVIQKSIQIKTGKSFMAIGQDTMSTGNVVECVTVVVQGKTAMFTAMYHYYENTDQDFGKLREFLEGIKKFVKEHSIDDSYFKVSLISSYLSVNFVITKRIVQEYGFVVHKQHVRRSAWLGGTTYVQSDDRSGTCGLLVFATPSELRVHKYSFNDGGNYGSDEPTGDGDCCVM